MLQLSKSFVPTIILIVMEGEVIPIIVTNASCHPRSATPTDRAQTTNESADVTCIKRRRI